MNILVGTSGVQASTNAYALVGSIMDASMALTVSFTIKNTGAQTILWQVLAGNTSDLSDGVAVSAPATLAASAFGSYAVTTAPYAYYGLYVKSNVNDVHGQATVRGIAKG